MKGFMKFKLLLLFIGIQGSLWAQDIRVLSVDELFRLGVENSLRLKASRIEEVMANDRTLTAKTANFPEIQIGASTGYIGQPTIFRKGLSQTTHPDIPDWSHNYSAELTQNLYNGGKIRYRNRQASLEKQIATLNSTDQEAEIKMLLLQHYLDLFSLYKQKEVLLRNIEESTHRLKDIRQLKKEGVVTYNDEIRSKLQLTNYELAYREAQDNISIVSQQLDIILGLDESLLLEPDTNLLSTSVPLQKYEAYILLAYEHFPGLKIAEFRTQLAQNDVLISRSDNLPALSLRAGNTLARPLSSTMEDVFSNNWNVGLNLSYSLSSLYRNRHKLHEDRQNISLRQNAEEQIKQDIRVQVRSVYIKHVEALDRVKALLLSVQQANENYRIVQNRYMNQLSTMTDLLDASSIRLEAELQLTNARTEIIYTYYELMRTCGNL